MTFTKANNGSRITATSAAGSCLAKLLSPDEKQAQQWSGGKLSDLHASLTAPFMSLIQVQAYLLLLFPSDAHTHTPLSPPFSL